MSESLRLDNVSHKINHTELKKPVTKPEQLPFYPKVYSRDAINRFHHDFTPDTKETKKLSSYGIIGFALALLSLIFVAKPTFFKWNV